MGYTTNFVNVASNDDQAVSLLVGCINQYDPDCLERNENRPKLHFSIESRFLGLTRIRKFPASFRPALLCVLDYDLDDGYFLWKRVFDDAINANPPLLLDEFGFYNASNYSPHLYFDHWKRMFDLIPNEMFYSCSEIFAGKVSYGLFQNQSDFLKLIRQEFNAPYPSCDNTDTVWFSPACRQSTDQCVPLLLTGYLDWAIQRAYFLHLPVAVAVVNAGPTDDDPRYISAVTAGRFLFHSRAPHDFLADPDGNEPVRLNLPRQNEYEQELFVFRTGIDGLKPRNYGWRYLKETDPYVAFFASSIDLTQGDMDGLMRRSRALQLAGAARDLAARIAACEWVQGNEATWRAWIPTMCPPGAYSDDSLTLCIPCPAGSRCAGGSILPSPCPEDHYCPANCSTPSPCPPGRGAKAGAAVSPANCSACKAGSVPIGGQCVSTTTFIVSALVPAAVLLVAAVASRRLSSAYAKERTEQRLADALRARLCIGRRDRVYLSTERVPPWATGAGAMLVVPAAQLEAAVRFDELRGDFDPRLFDAFCARSRAYREGQGWAEGSLTLCNVPEGRLENIRHGTHLPTHATGHAHAHMHRHDLVRTHTRLPSHTHARTQDPCCAQHPQHPGSLRSLLCTASWIFGTYLGLKRLIRSA